MAKPNNKRKQSTTGIKVLLATASVAATITGWALLPANDPVQAANNSSQTPAINVPSTQDNGTNGTSAANDPGGFNTQPSQDNGSSNTVPDSGFGSALPQFQPQPMPFTRSHSSR